jgi:DNA-binding SARP family transcriptional activator
VEVRSSYYKRIYIDCVNELLSIYIKNDLFDKAIALSELALKFEQYGENIHLAYIKSLAETNRLDKAVTHYEQVVNIFYRDLGITVLPELSNFYNEIYNVGKGPEISINQIVTEIDEPVQKTGGFYCSYEVLKNLNRVQYRCLSR